MKFSLLRNADNKTYARETINDIKLILPSRRYNKKQKQLVSQAILNGKLRYVTGHSLCASQCYEVIVK